MCSGVRSRSRVEPKNEDVFRSSILILISISSRALKTRMCSGVRSDLDLDLDLEQSPKNGDVFRSEPSHHFMRGPSPHLSVDRVRIFAWTKSAFRCGSVNHATSPKLYRSYYPHRSRELVSPYAGFFYYVNVFVK